MSADPYETDAFQRRIQQLLREPWAPWVRKSLQHILAAFAPTLDAAKMVAKLEKDFRWEETTPLTLSEKARSLGHAEAFHDFAKQSKSEDWERTLVDAEGIVQTLKKTIPIDQFTVEERAIFHREFAFAYERTFDAAGKPSGFTDATLLYLQILIHASTWLVEGRPRSIAELNRRMFAGYKLPPVRTKLEMLQREDEIKAREKRLQQVCDRIGLRLRPSIRNLLKRRRL